MTGKIAALAPTPISPALEYAHLIRKPGDLICPQGLVFPKAEQFIRRHLAKLMGSVSQEAAERFGLVDGPPGTGKTVLVSDGCSRAGFAVANIPNVLLAGETENAATVALTNILQGLVAYSQATGERMAAVVDDFHLSIAGNMSKGATVGRTVNSDLLVGELQRLADPPRPYRSACGTVIPIFFTGNDFSNITPSLFRNMRANRYTHAPTFEEKVHLIFQMLNPRTRDEVMLVEKLIRAHRREPIAFWAALKNDLLTAHLDDTLPEGPLTKAAVDATWPKRLTLDADKAWALAKARATHKLVSFY